MLTVTPRFRLRHTRPAWQTICGIDVDRMLREGNAYATLNAVVDELTFSKIDSEELRFAGFDAATKMIRLLQLTCEYLLHVQESTRNELARVEKERTEDLEKRTSSVY